MLEGVVDVELVMCRRDDVRSGLSNDVVKEARWSSLSVVVLIVRNELKGRQLE